MKKVFYAAMLSLLVFSSCADNDQPSKESGDEQVPAPVTNSGAETETDRATNAIKDSSRVDTTKKDSLNR
ncbi:MAG TPA: hypothetical protein VM012_04625 [Flavitalea sp.]|nr:hypothetical protein [Flavitalea sp.]